MRELKDILVEMIKNEQSLDLHSIRNLQESYPYLLETFKTNNTLLKLNLSDMRLDENDAPVIAAAMESNTTLLDLDLSWNKFMGHDTGIIMQGLANNSMLQVLTITNNDMVDTDGMNGRSIAELLHINKTLQVLDLSHNWLFSESGCNIAEALEKNTTLLSLSLEGNYLGCISMENSQSDENEAACALAKAMETNKTLLTLNLKECDVTGYRSRTEFLGKKGSLAFAKALQINHTLQTLVLGDNTIHADGARAIFESLKTNSTLHTLDLSRTDLDIHSVRVLAEMLQTNTSIHTLNLSGNKFNPEAICILAEALKTNTSIHTLDLNGAPNQEIHLYDTGATALADMLKINKTLHTLTLNNNKIGPRGAEDLAEALKTNTSLTTLELNKNHIAAQGINAFAETLEINTSLHTLLLGQNKLGTGSLTDLTKVLKDNQTLHTLDLGHNELLSNDAQELAAALEKNTALHTLFFGYNYIGPQGARAFTSLLEKNTTLRKLSLNDNKLSDEGAQPLIASLKTNIYLQVLDLDGNRLNKETGQVLIDTLKNNTQLHSLNVRDNCFENSLSVEIINHNYTILTLNEYPVNSRTLVLLQRNKAIQSILSNLGTYVAEDGLTNEDQLNKDVLRLESLEPELLTDNSLLPVYLIESHQLLKGLDAYFNKHDAVEALDLILNPIQTKYLLPAYERLAAEILMALDTEELSLDMQRARYQLLLYSARRQPHSQTFKTGLSGLKQISELEKDAELKEPVHAFLAEIQKSPGEIMGVEDSQLLSYEDLLQLAADVFSHFAPEDNSAEKQVIAQYVQDVTYHPLSAKFLWECPNVRFLYEKKYPLYKNFCLIEDYLLNPKNPKIFGLNDKYTHKATSLFKWFLFTKQKTAHLIETNHLEPFVTIDETLQQAKNTLIKHPEPSFRARPV